MCLSVYVGDYRTKVMSNELHQFLNSEALPHVSAIVHSHHQGVSVLQGVFSVVPQLVNCQCSVRNHCSTCWKVAGSIADCFIGIFHWLNRSGRTVALGSTRTLTEMSTRGISWGGKGGQFVGLTTLPHACADSLENLVTPTSWRPKGLSRPI
jgi:hypothetical protein